MGLAGRAARKLVPVVLTLGSGPSGFPRKLSRRRLKLPRQPGRGASLALASVILALGAGPLRLETTFRATAEASATAMANPRRRSRALRCSGAGGWLVGLPETISGRRPKLLRQRARFRRFGAGGWPDGLPETSFRATKAEGSWNANGRNGRFINQKRTSGQICKFGMRMADFILSRVRSLSAAKPSHFYQGLAELQLYQGRPAAVAVLSSLGGARPVILALGAGPLLLETTFRATAEASATAAPSLACAPLFWRWGLASGFPKQFPGDGRGFCDSLPRARFRRFRAGRVAGRASRNKFPSDESGGILERQ